MRSLNPQQTQRLADGATVRCSRHHSRSASRRWGHRHVSFACAPLAAAAQLVAGAPAFAQSHPQAPEPSSAASAGDVRPDSDAPEAERAEANWLGAPGFEGSFRIGFGLPFGNATQGRSQEELSPWRAPLWFDIVYRSKPSLAFGAYAQLLLGPGGDNCQGSCNWETTRLGAQLQWSVDIQKNHRTWVGLGAGYEWFTRRDNFVQPGPIPENDGPAPNPVAVRALERLSGPEAILQAGWDYAVGNALSVGPFIAASLGRYSGDSLTCTPPGNACRAGVDSDGSTIHGWISVGLRATYFP